MSRSIGGKEMAALRRDPDVLASPFGCYEQSEKEGFHRWEVLTGGDEDRYGIAEELIHHGGCYVYLKFGQPGKDSGIGYATGLVDKVTEIIRHRDASCGCEEYHEDDEGCPVYANVPPHPTVDMYLVDGQPAENQGILTWWKIREAA